MCEYNNDVNRNLNMAFKQRVSTFFLLGLTLWDICDIILLIKYMNCSNTYM